MKDFFTIGELGKLFGMNIRTLRYYDAIGLLVPERTDPVTNYRYYSTRQFERLNTIKYLRTLDMPLVKIQNFFDSRDTEKLTELLKEQQQETRNKIRELERIDKKISGRLAALADIRIGEYEEVREIHIGERRAALLRKDIPVGSDLEFPLRELEQTHHLEPLMFLGKVGVSISGDRLLERRFQSFSGIFVLIEEEDFFEGEHWVFPEQEYAVIRFQGVHASSASYYLKILDYLEERGYVPDGSSVEITLVDEGITNDRTKFVTEIQIPYRKKQ